MSVAGSLLTRVRLYEAVRRKGSRRSIRQAAHGWPAVHRVRRRCHRPVSRAWAARRPSTAVAAPAARAPGRSSQGACPRCTRALATGSQNRAGARDAQRPRRLWQSSFPTPDAVSLVQTVAHCSQCGTGHLSAHDGRERRAPIPGCSCRFVRVCFYHETVISPPPDPRAPVSPHAATGARGRRGRARTRKSCACAPRARARVSCNIAHTLSCAAECANAVEYTCCFRVSPRSKARQGPCLVGIAPGYLATAYARRRGVEPAYAAGGTPRL